MFNYKSRYMLQILAIEDLPRYKQHRQRLQIGNEDLAADQYHGLAVNC